MAARKLPHQPSGQASPQARNQIAFTPLPALCCCPASGSLLPARTPPVQASLHGPGPKFGSSRPPETRRPRCTMPCDGESPAMIAPRSGPAPAPASAPSSPARRSSPAWPAAPFPEDWHLPADLPASTSQVQRLRAAARVSSHFSGLDSDRRESRGAGRTGTATNCDPSSRAVPSRHAHRVPPLIGGPLVILDAGDHRPARLHGRQRPAARGSQNRLTAPRRLHHQKMR